MRLLSNIIKNNYGSYNGQFTIHLITLPIVFAVFYIPCNVSAHPIHLSVTRIEYNAQHESLEISVKLFTEDLERALEQQGYADFFRRKEDNYPALNHPLKTYINSNFGVYVEGEEKKTEFIGKEVNRDVLWCYFEIHHVKLFEKIRVKNTIFFDLFGDQSNLVHVYINDKHQSMMLDKDNKEDTLVF